MTTPRILAEKTEIVPIGRLRPHPRNSRHGDVGAISGSLEAHGQYRTITVQRSTNFVLAGNHTYKAALALGADEIAVGYVDVDDEEALRIMLADNRTADLATNDEPALAELLTELTGSDLGLFGTGYEPDDLDDLIASLGPSDGDERYTPEWLFEAMDVEFDIDLAAPPGGIPYIPARKYWTKQDDALAQDWAGLFAWCNPPYSLAAKFGQKWMTETTDGVWLGPVSHSTQYRVDMFETAKLLWFPGDMEFVYRGTLEGIAFPVFLAGFGPKGERAIRNLVTSHPDLGQAFKRARFRG